MRPYVIIIGLSLALVLGVGLPLDSCKTAPKNEEHYFLNLADNVEYVGMEKCKVCHTEHYNTFSQTGMGQSFDLLSPTKSAAFGKNSSPIYDAKTGMFYAATWQENRLFIKEFKLSSGDTTYQRQEEIKYVVGSGHHTNSHFWEENGYLFQAPLTFYTQKGIWDLPPGFETYNSRWDRKIEVECMSCHNAMPKVQDGTRNKYIHLPNGIDCERCHGPGQLHVAEKTAGKIVDTANEADRTIVNPKRLPWKLQIDVCQRCHLQGNNVLKPGKSFTDFKPGMRLSDVFEIYMPTQQNGEFVMAGHAERFQMSECFKQSNANIEEYNPKLNFTCINCHNPHVSVRKTNTEKFNNTCKGCHTTGGKSKLTLCSAPKANITAAQNNCVSCHMPASSTKDIPHVSVHDHYITKPSKRRIIKASNELMYCVNEKQGTQMTKALITWYEKFDADNKFLTEAAKTIQTEKPELQIHYYYAHQQWASILPFISKIDLAKTDEWTAYRIGKALDKSQKLNESLPAYQAAYLALPADDQFAAEYANALIRMGQFARATEVLTNLQKQITKSVLLHYNWALLYANTSQLSKASFHIKKALLLNSSHKGTLDLQSELQKVLQFP
jgi:predicted CXXCH cytochrome family protein